MRIPQQYAGGRRQIPMPNKRRGSVQDARVERSMRALGQALIALVQERDFSDITVQQILDRAGVARATFYAHYRNKQDVLDASYERLFERLEEALEARRDHRVFPVAEFLRHADSARDVVPSIERASGAAQLRAAFIPYMQRIIERRFAPAADAKEVVRTVAARMLAGALMELIDWWYVHPQAATPEDMDRAFHQLVRAMIAPVPHGPAPRSRNNVQDTPAPGT